MLEKTVGDFDFWSAPTGFIASLSACRRRYLYLWNLSGVTKASCAVRIPDGTNNHDLRGKYCSTKANLKAILHRICAISVRIRSLTQQWLRGKNCLNVVRNRPHWCEDLSRTYQKLNADDTLKNLSNDSFLILLLFWMFQYREFLLNKQKAN